MQGKRQRYRWIEMRTAERAQKSNQNRKYGDGRASICKQRDGVVVR